MSATIDRRARISGTRITIYDVLTYAEAGWRESSIAAMLGLSTAQVQTAVEYIAENRETVLEVDRRILARIERGNPPEIETKRQQSHELLVAKLLEIRARTKG